MDATAWHIEIVGGQRRVGYDIWAENVEQVMQWIEDPEWRIVDIAPPGADWIARQV